MLTGVLILGFSMAAGGLILLPAPRAVLRTALRWMHPSWLWLGLAIIWAAWI